MSTYQSWKMEFLEKTISYVQSLEDKIQALEKQVLERNLAIESLLRDPEVEESADSASTGGRVVKDKHLQFLDNLEKNKDSLEYVMTEHLRMQGAFWAIGSYDLLGSSKSDRQDVIDWVYRCY